MENKENKKKFDEVFVYGIGGPEDNYKVVCYDSIDLNDMRYKMRNLNSIASRMFNLNDDVEEVYLIDQDKNLYYAYRKAYQADTVAEWIAFRDLLQRDGYLWGKK